MGLYFKIKFVCATKAFHNREARMVTRYLSDPEAQDIEKIFCKDLLVDIHYYDGYRNCAVMAQWVLFVAHKYDLKLLEIENLLRLNNCHSYLIGLPSSELAEHQTSRDVFNKEFSDPKNQPFYLWICVNGEQEAFCTLRQHKITHKKNRENLNSTGVICQSLAI